MMHTGAAMKKIIKKDEKAEELCSLNYIYNNKYLWIKCE